VEIGEPLLGGGPGIGEVRGLWVLPAFRRLGIGTTLLKKAEEWAREEKLKRLEAAAPVTDPSGAASGLLRANRFAYDRVVVVAKTAQGLQVASPGQYWSKYRDTEHEVATAFAVYAIEL